MQEPVIVFKLLPMLIYFFSTLFAVLSGYLVYTGLSTQTERKQNRLRFREKWRNGQAKVIASAEKTGAESLLKEAGYPLGLNGVKYYIFFITFISFLVIYYIVFPLLSGNSVSIWTTIIIIGIYVFFLPDFPFSLFRYIIKRIVEYNQSKKNSEIFMLYDLIINEIEMMENTRINSYNLLRNLKSYFNVINGSITRLLSQWTDDEGPEKALDNFAEDLGTKEAKSLISVLKKLDENDRETALTSLKGMNNMFVRSQIENYRRRRKVTTDLSSIPIKVTHFLILLNFMVVVVYMVTIIMQSARN
ncbi:hypothetical protein [Sutcliffiella cohnii]|uniref:hypothetical protein n=1 Tax=Sutcliffiella cohnii TaxID=33932 RepID=UPI00082CC6DE|nr:hypothetical protein [Sutcliffiella cohnii]